MVSLQKLTDITRKILKNGKRRARQDADQSPNAPSGDSTTKIP
jgi:hypothetical protein